MSLSWDDAEQFLPLYLRFVKGVIDSSDLPLKRVPRAAANRMLICRRFRGALTRRVLDMLVKMAGDDTEDYGSFWREFGNVIKEGAVEDPTNKDKIAKLLRFCDDHNPEDDDQDQSLDDYVGPYAGGGRTGFTSCWPRALPWAAASPTSRANCASKESKFLLLTDRIDAWVVDSLGELRWQGRSPTFAREELSTPGRATAR